MCFHLGIFLKKGKIYDFTVSLSLTPEQYTFYISYPFVRFFHLAVLLTSDAFDFIFKVSPQQQKKVNERILNDRMRFISFNTFAIWAQKSNKYNIRCYNWTDFLEVTSKLVWFTCFDLHVFLFYTIFVKILLASCGCFLLHLKEWIFNDGNSEWAYSNQNKWIECPIFVFTAITIRLWIFIQGENSSIISSTISQAYKIQDK